MTIALRLEPADDAALSGEYQGNLRHGRALVAEVADADPLTPVLLVLVRPSDGAELVIPGQIVMLLPDGPVRGTALELDFSRPGSREQLERFVAGEPAEPEPALEPLHPHPHATGGAAIEAFGGLVPLEPIDEEEAVSPDATYDALAAEPGCEPAPAHEAHEAFGGLVPLEPIEDEPLPSISSLPPPSLEPLSPVASTAPVETAEEEPATDDDDGHPDDGGAPLDNKLLRIRKLSVSERTRCAREGSLEDRVMLERIFGKTVWEDLLRNPMLTIPEVARIASKGSAPRPLIEQIVDNPQWARQSLVRRALLTNPRVSNDGIGKLLRVTPKNELRLICQTTAYPAAVRNAAKKLLTE